MANNKNSFERIEQYLANELPEQDRQAFEAALATDAELRKAVTDQRSFGETIRDYGFRDRAKWREGFAEEKNIPQETAPNKKTSANYWLLLIPLALLILIMWWRPTGGGVEEPENSPPAETKKIPSPIKKDEPVVLPPTAQTPAPAPAAAPPAKPVGVPRKKITSPKKPTVPESSPPIKPPPTEEAVGYAKVAVRFASKKGELYVQELSPITRGRKDNKSQVDSIGDPSINAADRTSLLLKLESDTISPSPVLWLARGYLYLVDGQMDKALQDFSRIDDRDDYLNYYGDAAYLRLITLAAGLPETRLAYVEQLRIVRDLGGNFARMAIELDAELP